jgi:dephospho-CoA kinase
VFLVGLTGNYGMGKSTVLSEFRKLGALTLDTDTIVKTLLEKEDVLGRIRGILDEEVFDTGGVLDKKKVAQKIFRKKTFRRSLEDILHPLVFEKIDSFLKRWSKSNKIVIIEVPLLFERDYGDRFDKIITVCCEQRIALDRLEKAGITAGEALLRLKSQLPITEKIKRSDFVIDNSGTMRETKQRIKELYGRFSEEEDHGNHYRA